jgi:hypothetical protein
LSSSLTSSCTVIKRANVSFIMLLTSCYSGGSLLQPNLNVSGLTAAGPRSPSLSWTATLGGRSHESIYSTAVREALTKMESEKRFADSPSF